MQGTIGMIGGGNMGSAMIGGLLQTETVSAQQIFLADASADLCSRLNRQYGVFATTDNREVASKADYLFLAVKPQICAKVIEQISESISSKCVVISIAAGQTIHKLEQWFGRPVKLIRAMPNTPALVGEGMSALSANALVLQQELEAVQRMFESFGQAIIVPEHLMDIVTAVSGSSPAYVYLFLEAMADAAVRGGMPRDMAYHFCAQAVLGAAKMVLETGEHPAVLKDRVCSPGGTTIEAVAELEKQGLRQAVMAAVQVCEEKSKKLNS